jgi:diacylglycerol kinase (ATP)
VRVLVVFNERSGSSDDAPREAICAALEPLGDVRSVAPSAEEFAAAVDGAAAGADLVVAAGGDGTVNRVLNAVRDHLDRIELAVVPMGTGNDFARTMGMPEDPEEAARAIAAGRVRPVDYGEAKGPGVERLFLNACIGGFPVAVDEHVSDTVKTALGPLAYVAAGAQAAAELTRARVTVNGTVVEDCVAAGVGNGPTCGGGVRVWPRARPDDGLLDACAMGAPGALRAARLAAKVRGGSHVEMETVHTDRAAQITIESDPEMELNVDGELLGLTTPATFRVTGTVRVRAPG